MLFCILWLLNQMQESIYTPACSGIVVITILVHIRRFTLRKTIIVTRAGFISSLVLGFKSKEVVTRKYPLRGYILGVLPHTTA